MHSLVRSFFAIAALVAVPCCLATTFQLTDLGTSPGSTRSAALSINDKGVAAGYSVDPVSQQFLPLIFKKGRAIDVLAKAGQSHVNGMAVAINRKGTVAGRFTSDQFPKDTLFLTQGDQVSFVAPPSDVTLSVGSLNDQGTAVGSLLYPELRLQAFKYEGGQWITLPADRHHPDAEARGINNQGAIVGASYNGQGDWHATLWQNGQRTLLPDLGGNYSVAAFINDAGDILGYSRLPGKSKVPHAMLVRNGVAIALDAVDAKLPSYPSAINLDGWIVGNWFSSQHNEPAFFSDGGPLQDLNGMLSAEQQAAWFVFAATDINELGEISGAALRRDDGSTHAVVLKPLP